MHAEYRDRTHAGLVLARHLQQYADHDNLLVLALPRGGVPVAREVATALSAPLDVLVVRKLGVPGQEELAMGAIASGGVCILNRDILSGLAVSKETLDAVIDREQRELEQHERSFRGDQPPLDVRDKLIIIVDDGLATGATMRAAVAALRHLHPKQITVAVPLAPKDTIQTLQHEADAVVCPFTPEHFGGVGGWYEDFSQVSNDDVRSMLQLGRGD